MVMGMRLARVLLMLLWMSLDGTGLVGAGAADRARATVLLDIEIERSAGETKVHLKADGAIKDYREVRLKKNVAADRPDRMYLDIRDVRLNGPLSVKKAGTALAQVRTGLRGDGVRVVFDSGLADLFEYTITEQADGLLVTVREPSAEPVVISEIIPGDASRAETENDLIVETATIYPEPRAAGDLDLLIVPSNSLEQTLEWLDSQADPQIGLQILQTVKADQEINTSFLVTGVSRDRNGDFAVAVSFILLDPSGKPAFNKRRLGKTSGQAPAKPAFILADPLLSLTLGESDPAGIYKMIASVEDLTTNKIFRTSRRIIFEK